jgi:hypothetical protein
MGERLLSSINGTVVLHGLRRLQRDGVSGEREPLLQRAGRDRPVPLRALQRGRAGLHDLIPRVSEATCSVYSPFIKCFDR